MDELQSDDLYIPEVLLNLPANDGSNEQKLEDKEDVLKSFMKSIESWSEFCLVEEGN
jgi:hypothetical protein